MFGRGWEPGNATIVAMKETSPATTGEHGFFRALYAYVADVQPDSGAAVFRTEMDEPFNVPNWFTPGVGDVLPVHCDPRHGRAKFDMGRLKAATKARSSAAKDEQAAAFDAARRAAPGTTVPGTLGDPRMVVLDGLSAGAGDAAPQGAADAGDPLDRLQTLADLHDRGALTDAEFAAAKAKLLADT
jgi:hypothetical protein